MNVEWDILKRSFEHLCRHIERAHGIVGEGERQPMVDHKKLSERDPNEPAVTVTRLFKKFLRSEASGRQ